MSIVYGVSGDVRQELGNPSSLEVSTEILEKGRLRATRVVNAFVEKAYPASVPFASSGDVPVLLNEITDELAVFYVKRLTHPGPMPLTEEVKEEYWEKPMQMLSDILEGKIILPELTGNQGDNIVAGTEGPDGKPYTPIFNLDDDKQWMVYPDLLDDIADGRE